MKLKWKDVREIAILLEEKFPNEDNLNLRFTDLHKWIVEMDEFDDNSNDSNEKILEAIQMAWIDEETNANKFKDIIKLNDLPRLVLGL